MILILLKGAFIQDSPLSNIMETSGGLNPERIITRMAPDFQLKPSAVDDGDAFDCRPTCRTIQRPAAQGTVRCIRC